MNRVNVIFRKPLDTPSAAITVDREHICGIFNITSVHVKKSSQFGYKYDIHMNDSLIHTDEIYMDVNGVFHHYMDESAEFVNEKVNEWLKSQYEEEEEWME